GWHPLVREGHLPGGGAAEQRRRARPDSRGGSDPQWDLDQRHRDHAAGEGQGRPLDQGGRGQAAGPPGAGVKALRRVVLISKRGRFLVGELLFERSGRIELGGGRRAATPGRMALVELGQGRGRARVIRELGDPGLASDVIDALLEDRGVRRGFSKRIEEEAAEAPALAASEKVERRDLRELATFTVDPASAHDFDDAVSASTTSRGLRVWIHIADVAAHVRAESPIDAEAQRRANSPYVPRGVAPVPPRRLSNDACSLTPDRARLAVTSEIELSETGEPLSARFYRSVIRSDLRLDYDRLDEIFAGRSKPPE